MGRAEPGPALPPGLAVTPGRGPAGDGISSFRGKNRFLRLDDFEAAARKRLPRPLFAYVSGGVEDDFSRSRNRRAFSELHLVPRCLVDVSARSTETELFGERYAAPFGMAPMGLCAITAFRGDLVLARAARRAGIPMVVSGSALTPLEKVLETNPQAWFQAYLPGDPAQRMALVDRVEAAGTKVLVITVDVPVSANRENNVRAGFSTPLRPNLRLAWDGLTHPRWLFGTLLRTLLLDEMPHFENSFATRGAPIIARKADREFAGREFLSWTDMQALRKRWKGRLVLKGLLAPEDARRAREIGADGIIVSNHGGRQLDTSVSPLDALPGIVDAAPDLTVMLDSGVRRGTDILKAFALGAKFVFVGRPFNFAAATGGVEAVAWACELLSREVHRDLGLLGLNKMADVTEDILFRGRQPRPIA